MTKTQKRAAKRVYKLARQTPDYLALRAPGYVLSLLAERERYHRPDAKRETLVQARRWATGQFWFYANARLGYGLPGGERWKRYRAIVDEMDRGAA